MDNANILKTLIKMLIELEESECNTNDKYVDLNSLRYTYSSDNGKDYELTAYEEVQKHVRSVYESAVNRYSQLAKENMMYGQLESADRNFRIARSISKNIEHVENELKKIVEARKESK